MKLEIGQNIKQVIVGMIWRGGRAVECTGLENRRPFTGLVSSNLTLSANKNRQMLTGRPLAKTSKNSSKLHAKLQHAR